MTVWKIAILIEDFRRWRSWGQNRRTALHNTWVTWRLL